MDTTIVFAFRDQLFPAVAFFSFEETPFLIFVLIKDPDLILEFGEELTIHTDCEKVQFRNSDSTEIRALKQTIFKAVRHTEPFLKAKEKANC